MPATPQSPRARRLRWALFVALGLHLLLLLRYAPSLFERFETSRRAVTLDQPLPQDEQIVEITPPPPPSKSRGMALATSLGASSPEALQPQLPPDFFDKPKLAPSGALHIAADLDFARASGLQIVANIVPAATRLPQLSRVGEVPRAPRPRQAPVAAPLLPAPEPAAPAGEAEAAVESAAQVPYLLPPQAPAYDMDAAIARAAEAAEQSARSSTGTVRRRGAPDYRAMLPQGPVVEAPPLPLGGDRREAEPEGITTYALDAPAAADAQRVAPEEGRAFAAARQQFFGTLTARLKASNVRQLAEAVRAGPKTTVRMKFLVDRSGKVLDVQPAAAVSKALAERAAAVILATALPRVPDAMTQVPVELSYPVEVYQ